ncbi:MAG: RsmB/NOP family class I SAM-dependent RNA methyltransferase [Candidatus Melainabacteria bacterium]
MSTPSKRFPPTARGVCLAVLSAFEQNLSRPQPLRLKADQLLGEQLGRCRPELSGADRALARQLMMTALRHWPMHNEWMLLQSGARRLKDIPPLSRSLLRLGMVQLSAMDQVPDYAAIDETIRLARALKTPTRAIGFLNGMLRGIQRRRDAGDLPRASDQQVQGIPRWFLDLLASRQPGTPEVDLIARIQTPKALTLRVNTLQVTPQAYQQTLEAADIAWLPLASDHPELLVLPGWQGNPATLPGFAEGQIYLQDPHSAAVAYAVAPRAGMRILDACAAPGSKTTHMAALSANQARITALEPMPERAGQLQENCSRLGAQGVTIHGQSLADYAATATDLPEGGFDAVLVDAPCSGLGTVRQHPEILLQCSPAAMPAFTAKQWELLQTAGSLVREGGTLVYSTCSVHPAENEELIDRYLAAHPQFSLNRESGLPLSAHGDGFYLAVLTRRAD